MGKHQSSGLATGVNIVVVHVVDLIQVNAVLVRKGFGGRQNGLQKVSALLANSAVGQRDQGCAGHALTVLPSLGARCPRDVSCMSRPLRRRSAAAGSHSAREEPHVDVGRRRRRLRSSEVMNHLNNTSNRNNTHAGQGTGICDAQRAQRQQTAALRRQHHHHCRQG